MKQWYISREGERYGPYTPEQLRQYFEEGHFIRGDLFWDTDTGKWLSYDETFKLPAAENKDSGSKTIPPPPVSRKIKPLTFALFGALLVVILVVVILSSPGGRDGAHPGTFLPGQQELDSLSLDQKVLYSMFGAPDHFAITFERDTGGYLLNRVETWAYQHLNYFYLFENGNYMGGWRAPYIPTIDDDYGFTPMHFNHDLSTEFLSALIGREPAAVEESRGFTTYSFGNGVLIMSFDADGRLVTVIRSPEVRDAL